MYKTPLSIAVENGNLDIIQLLISNQRIDVNAMYKISNLIILTQFKKKIFNSILSSNYFIKLKRHMVSLFYHFYLLI